jgi:hypothetical protein
MSEPYLIEDGERTIDAAPKAHGCTIPSAPGDLVHGTPVHGTVVHQ